MNNPPLFLVTTADERSWRRDCPALCLGAWCCTYDRLESWKELQAEVVTYHWDDRDKLHSDYLYLRKLHEVLLGELSEALNLFHGTQHSIRYWRILVGPWLLYFTQILFDRWTMIQRAVERYQISETAVMDFVPDQDIPKDMEDFRGKYATDLWNHVIYGRILKRWTSIVCSPILRKGIAPVDKPDGETRPGKSFSRWAYEAISRLSQLGGGATNAFFISTFLPLTQDFLLQVTLGQLPKLNLQIAPVKFPPNPDARKNFFPNNDTQNGFENCIRAMIAEQIPTVYLEGYEALQLTVSKLPWPKKPKLIFTSASYNSDDVFKAWAGLQVDGGTPLIIGQHGGNLGSALWSSSEDHEIAIADRYVTWGWSDGNPKQYPVGVLKQIGGRAGVWNPKGKLLLVTSVMPRYSYVMGGFTVAAGQVDSNLDDQYRFIRALPKDIYNDVVVRLFTPDWGWSQAKRWKDRMPDIHISSGTEPMEPLIRQSRLYVATYNATTFLESLSRNIPTIMFWNFKHWELRESAAPYFYKLEEAGIFHSCPDAAAAKVAEVWRDVEEWWSRPEVQNARQSFCDRYARIPKDGIRELRQAITTAHGRVDVSCKN